LLNTLARLPFRLIVTTNYDRLMERALEQNQQPRPTIVTQPIHGFTPREQRGLRARLAGNDGLILYKIHDTFVESNDATLPGQVGWRFEQSALTC
jgi:hypothetical protein